MFGDRDHDRRVADGAAGVGVLAGVIGAFIWLGMVKGYYELFRRFPKATFGMTVLALLALVFLKQLGAGLNWFTVREHLPDGQYLVERHIRDQPVSKFTLIAKNGKISRDGKNFEEVRWERDLMSGSFVMTAPDSQPQGFFEREDEEGRTYFRVVHDFEYRLTSEPDSPVYGRPRFAHDRHDIYHWTTPEELAVG